MKKKILSLILAGFLSAPQAFAGEQEWEDAGKALAVIEGLRILTGGTVDVIGGVTGINKPFSRRPSAEVYRTGIVERPVVIREEYHHYTPAYRSDKKRRVKGNSFEYKLERARDLQLELIEMLGRVEFFGYPLEGPIGKFNRYRTEFYNCLLDAADLRPDNEHVEALARWGRNTEVIYPGERTGEPVLSHRQYRTIVM